MIETAILLFIIAIIVAVISIFKRVNIALALLMAFTIYSVPLLGSKLLNIVSSSFNTIMLNTVLALTFALILANLYRKHTASEELVQALRSIGYKFAGLATPAIIGLLPMPAGAYISAVMVDPVYNELGLTREEKTFINYWFRHIWVTVWPLYQGIILASGILKKSIIDIISMTWPIGLAGTIAGLIVFSRIVRKKNNRLANVNNKDNTSLKGLIHVWPFLLIALLSLMGLHVSLAVLIAVVFFIAIYRIPLHEVFNVVKKSIDFTLIGIVVVSLVFSNSIEATGLPQILINILSGQYLPLVLFLIPFIVVVAAPVEFTYVALTFPIISSLMHGVGLTIAFLGGYMGVMLSPVHACLVMSSRYYNATLQAVYKYIIPAAILTITITILFSFILLSV